jgi:hypothetical protein
MSDVRLRELERRTAETGTVADEAAFLRERVRAGRLDRARLEAAACVGSEAARAALGGTPDGRQPLTFWWLGYDGKTGEPRWSKAVAELGEVASFRVGLALARAHLDLAPDPFRASFESLLNDLERDLIEQGEVPRHGARPLPGSHVTPVIVSLLWPELSSPEDGPEARRPWRRFWNIRCDGQVARERVRAELVPWLLD